MSEPLKYIEVGMRTALVGIAVNAVLGTVKIVAGLTGNSYALIADGIESLNDILGSGVVLLSLRVAAIPPDENHPYGHGKAEQLGALLAAVLLLSAGGVIAYHSAQNLFVRHDPPSWFTLPVLATVILAKEMLSRHVLRKSQLTSSAALRGDAWHHRADAITSGAAFVGITVALIGGRGYERADDIAALLACLVIGFNGVVLLRNALHENMDGAPPPDLQAKVREVAGAVGGVLAIEKLRMKKIGLSYFADLHVQVHGGLSVVDGHRIGHDVKRALIASSLRIGDVVVHVEPHPE